MELRLLAVNASDGFSNFVTPTTRIRRLMGGTHWSAPYYVFGEATAVGISATKSEKIYSYKTDFEIWRENQDFRHQNISMSQPPFYSTPIGTNITNRKKSPIDSIPIGTKMP